MQKPSEGCDFMLPNLNGEELEEMRLAMQARLRANGSGTKNYQICAKILRKMAEAERNPVYPSGKKAGVDSQSMSYSFSLNGMA